MTKKRKPSLLPEQDDPRSPRPKQRPSRPRVESDKRRTQSTQRAKPTQPMQTPSNRQSAPPRRIKRQRRRASASMTILALILAVTLIGVTTVILYDPDLIGLAEKEDLALTEISFMNTASALVLTSDSLNATGVSNAQRALDIDSTMSSFNIANTQSARDTQATQTSVANSNAQQATQSAIEFQATQAEFERAATQSELNYQSTQAFLNQNATAVALGFATAPANNSGNSNSAQTTLATPPPFSEGFTQELDSGLWTLSAPTDWRLADRGDMIAQRNGAWLLTQRTDLRDYALDITFQPPVVAESYQHILLNMSEAGGGITLELYFVGNRLSAVSIYQINYAQINASQFLTAQERTLIQGVVTDTPIGETVNVQVDVRNGRFGIFIDERAIMDIILDVPLSTGAVGVYVTQNSRVEHVAILR